MDGQKKHLSPSALSMLSKCGVQYAFRYIEGKKIPPAAAMIAGTAVDTAANADLTSKMVVGELEPEEKILSIARDTVHSKWDEEGVHLSKEELEVGEKIIKGQVVDKSVALAALHHAQVAPVIEPIAVQRRFRVPLEDFPFDLVGVIDVQEATAVRDLKTAGKSPSKDTAENSDQLTFYGLGISALDGAAPEKLVLDTLVYTPAGNTSIVTLETTRSDKDYLVQMNRIERAAEVIEGGHFMPARPDDWWCSEKWCGYHSICPYVRQPVQIAVTKGETKK